MYRYLLDYTRQFIHWIHAEQCGLERPDKKPRASWTAYVLLLEEQAIGSAEKLRGLKFQRPASLSHSMDSPDLWRRSLVHVFLSPQHLIAYSVKNASRSSLTWSLY